MATVRFYGDLEKFGRTFKLDVLNTGEAIRALIFQIPGLQKHLNSGFYRVRIAGHDISEADIQSGLFSSLSNKDVIHIIPKTIGAKNGGLFSFIAGAVLVVVGIIGNIYGGWGTPLINAGIGLMVSGVATMLTKMPTMSTSEGEKHNNTLFSNLDNAVTQGEAIPLCYGEIMIGSKVLSQGLSTH